jgi:8-oxo-dGTP diphosphatase
VTTPDPTLVVGVAIVRAGRLLIARRTGPADLAGLWELPGGKVEAGESVGQAAVREIAEELGVAITVTAQLPDRYPVSGRYDMAVVRAVIAEPAEPTASGSHDAVRWLDVAELTAAEADPHFAWVPPDVPAVAAVRAAGWLAAV